MYYFYVVHKSNNKNWKFMCKSEIFFKLLGLTERETEVPRERILGDFRDMESTDARYVLVRLLSEAGLYPDQIAGRPTARHGGYGICWPGTSPRR